LGFIYLLKQNQGNGIGRQLITVLARRLIQQGHHSMLVCALAANHNRIFYEAMGGKLIGTRNINIGGANLTEVCYGWKDIAIFQHQNSSSENQSGSK